MLVLLGVFAFAMLCFCGLVIDVGRLYRTVREAQNAADAASLAGVNQLRAGGLPLSAAMQLTNWKNVKRAVLLSLSSSTVSEMDGGAIDALASDSGAGSFRFTDSTTATTPHDDLGYDRYGGHSGNFQVKVVRGLFCYDQVGSSFVRRWYSLEQPNQYCLANSVRVDLTIFDFRTYFAQIFGAARVPEVRIRSTAYLNNPNTCGDPLCSSLGSAAAGSDEFAPYFTPLSLCP